MIFIAYFDKDEALVLEQLTNGQIVLDKFNQQDVEYEDSKDLEGLMIVKKKDIEN